MRRHPLAVGVVCAFLAVAATDAQTGGAPRAESAESATARRFAALRGRPLQQLAFLREMPKGGDLHTHLSGAVYAESYLKWAAQDNLCLATATMAIVAGTCDAAAGRPPATAVLANAALYAQAIDAMSMRHWNPALSGHDHFFTAFAKFGPAAAKTGDMLAEAAARAAAERVSYLELMLSPAGTASARLAREVGWIPDLAALRDRLLAAGLKDAVAAEAKQRLDDAERRKAEVLRCASPQADSGCAVTVRYIAQVARAAAPELVFTQMLAGFELVGADSRIVSLNLVQPEDDVTAVRDFRLQMSMLDFLHRQYPRVPISLHAGELSQGLVPPEDLRFHIRHSVETGHARRIGHGVDLAYEDDPFSLLRDMAAKKVLVEIALTSNDVILGVKGTRHPLGLYLQYGVPVALVTDDLGVSRSSHTQEFLKAVEDHGLDYRTLKRMARNSIAYSFADGQTLKRLQTELEAAFRAFEGRQSAARSPAP